MKLLFDEPVFWAATWMAREASECVSRNKSSRMILEFSRT